MVVRSAVLEREQLSSERYGLFAKVPLAVAAERKPQKKQQPEQVGRVVGEEGRRIPDQTLVSLLAGGAGGLASALLAHGAKYLFDRHLSRRRLLSALIVECEGCMNAIRPIVAAANETKPNAERLVALCKDKAAKLEHSDVHTLYAGWVVFTPKIGTLDGVERLRPAEARALVNYVDALERFAEAERRYSRAFHDLLNATPDLECGSIRDHELAHQIDGHLGLMVEIGNELLRNAWKLKVTCKLALKSSCRRTLGEIIDDEFGPPTA